MIYELGSILLPIEAGRRWLLKILSSGMHLLDMFSKDLIECKAVGNISSQFQLSKLCECSNIQMVFHFIPLNLSHWRLPCEWCGVVVDVSIPISLKYFLIDIDGNAEPQSECIVLGVSKLQKIHDKS